MRLAKVLDPAVLSAADVVDRYARRWKSEEAFLLTKRLLGPSYLGVGAFNAVAMQVWATWLSYAALADLTDAVAEELDQPLTQAVRPYPTHPCEPPWRPSSARSGW